MQKRTTWGSKELFFRKHNPFFRSMFLWAFFHSETVSVCHILFSPSFLFLFPCRNNSSNSSFFPHPPVFSSSSSAAKAKIWWRRGGGGSEASPCVRAGAEGRMWIPQKFALIIIFYWMRHSFLPINMTILSVFSGSANPIPTDDLPHRKRGGGVGRRGSRRNRKGRRRGAKRCFASSSFFPRQESSLCSKDGEAEAENPLLFLLKIPLSFSFPFFPPSRAYCSWLMPPPDLLKGMGEKKGGKGLFRWDV